MRENLRDLLVKQNAPQSPASPFEAALIIATVGCLIFDVIQIFTGGGVFFSLISALAVVVGAAGLLKLIDEGQAIYVCAYLIPATCYLLAIAYRIFFWAGVDPTPYALNGWISVVTSLLPPVAAVASSIVVPPISALLKCIEKRL